MNITKHFDVLRTVRPSVEKHFDLLRTVSNEVTKHFDFRVNVPYANVDFSRLNITLQANALSDTFNMTVPKGTPVINDIIEGSIYGWEYSFAVEETNEQNQVIDYLGRYDCNKLRYTNYRYTTQHRYRPMGVPVGDNSYSPPSRFGVSTRTIIGYIASQLRLNLVYRAEDWKYPLNLVGQDDTYGFYAISGTYQSILTQMFGWLKDLPNIDFIVTIRKDTLYVIQRGKENISYEITDNLIEFPPIVNKKRLHTEWSGNSDNAQNDLIPENEQVPFTGKIEYLGTELYFEEGLLKYEKNEDDGMGQRTDYDYEFLEDESGTPQPYLRFKETLNIDDSLTNSGSCSKTEYHYAFLGNEIYLASEIEYTGGEVVNGVPDYTDADVKEHQHVPLGNGWYGHKTVDVVENVVLNSSLSQGKSGNSVSRYMVDKVQAELNAEMHYLTEFLITMAMYFLNPPLIPTDYPVMNNDFIEKLIENTDWLNNKTEETVTLTFLGQDIIDMTKKISYKNNIYYLESNNITWDAETGIRQNIVMKRWY